jgi:hypothetical protein
MFFKLSGDFSQNSFRCFLGFLEKEAAKTPKIPLMTFNEETTPSQLYWNICLIL